MHRRSSYARTQARLHAACFVLLAALGTQMLRLAGQLADGTILWMTGPATVADHVVPTITEAAAAAGVRPVTARVRLHRARRKLRPELEAASTEPSIDEGDRS